MLTFLFEIKQIGNLICGVIIEAPHLSFEFTVTYMTDDFQRNMTAHQHAREQQKATRTKDAL